MFGFNTNREDINKQIEVGESIARLEDVTKKFGENPILNAVSLDIKKGEFVIVTGSSGAGKSTALRTLQGLETPDSGLVELFGSNWHDLSDKQKKAMKASRMAIGFQHDALDTGYSIVDNISSLSESKGRTDPTRVAEMASYFGLTEHVMRGTPTHKLSGGEKQRVALAREFMDRPELALLDEPLSALDTNGKIELYSAMHELSRSEGTTLVIVEHDKEVARSFATREIVFDRGQVVDDYALAPTARIMA